MREDKKLLFSPNCMFGELDFNDKEKLIRCFRDRIYGFYIVPARLLDKHKFGFGCGLLCVATIDSLARIVFSGEKVGCRIRKWIEGNIKDFRKRGFAQRFYEDFRCGLVHEGRIKNPGEFSYESDEIVTSKDGIVRINPRILLRKLEEAVERYIADLRGDSETFSHFKATLEKDFYEEVKREKTTNPSSS